MNMSITEMMNYRFENPRTNVQVDTKITEKFIGRPRENSSIENFELWGSVSKDSFKIALMVDAYKKQMSENTINKTI